MEQVYLIKYRDYLNYLADGGEPYSVGCGVCCSFLMKFAVEIHDSIPNYYSVIREFEYYSGDRAFPIKWKMDDPEVEYERSDNKWILEYGRRRRLFCKFLADYLNKIINDHTITGDK